MALKTTPDLPAVPQPSMAEADRVLTGGTPPIVIPDAAGDDPILAEFGMEEHPQGGFHGLLEVIPTRADIVLDLIRANSLWPLLSGLSCCAIEMMSTATSKNDIDRFGMFPFRASPRQADVLIVAGTLTTKMAGPLVRLWEQMPEPKWCVAMGTCTTSGGRFKRSYSVVQGVDRVMPVDVYVPGCPPRPEALIHGMMRLQELVKQRRGEWATYVDRGVQRIDWEGDVR
jgi:NADH-quinone oxidoreductase subunit B